MRKYQSVSCVAYWMVNKTAYGRQLGMLVSEWFDIHARMRVHLILIQTWFRQLDLAPFDLLIWPHPAGESSSSMEPPSGLVGTVESVLCFPSRCGNPRCERISISGVSFHRPPFSFFFAPFFFLCACPQFSTEKYRARIA